MAGIAHAMDLTPEILNSEDYQAFDSAAQYFVRMSGRNFLEAWNSGRFHDPDPDTHPGVLEVASIAPLDLLVR